MSQAQKHKEAAALNTELGLAYLQQGDRPRAKRKLLTALELAPNSAEVNAAMAFYLEKVGDMKEARTYHQKALSLAPNSGTQLNNYGTFLCRRGSYREAERYFLRAVKDVHYVYTAGAYENAGLCVAAIPDYLKAKFYFAKALEQDPQRKQALYELVKIELKERRAMKALAYLKQYSKLSANDPQLLKLAIEAAQQAGDQQGKARYTQRWTKITNFIDHTGANNEYDSNNG